MCEIKADQEYETKTVDFKPKTQTTVFRVEKCRLF